MFFSNSFDSSFNSALVSISSNKLEKGLQPILGSLGPIFVHKNNLFKLYDCKRCHLELVSILFKILKNQFQVVNQQCLRYDGQGIQS
jgi:hypothetical protein